MVLTGFPVREQDAAWPAKLRVEYPGANCYVTDRGDAGREQFDQSLEARRQSEPGEVFKSLRRG